ncbi:hypothetical protein EDC01DRAFT_361808 [Geopyxis carbonaria]|nr:hypothetical protein EDC01DRAFT_361808 [Geopyxis carbonaria]
MKIRGSSMTAAAAVVVGLILAGEVESETPPATYDPVKQFCRRFYHQAAKIGNRLYMDGGLVTALNGNHNHNYTNNLLTFHNLDDDTDRDAPLVNNLTKPAEAPSVMGGALWADEVNEKLYLFGGEYPDGLPKNTNDPQAVWSYDPWDNEWSKVKASGDFQRPSFGSHVSVDQLGQGFYLGGWLGPNNVPGWKGPKRALSGLIVYDFVHQTATNFSGPPGPPRVEGELFYVPVGDNGLLVSFGGMYAVDGREDQVIPAPLNEIDVYDITQSMWSRVNATGTVPGQRRRFCGGLTSAEDGSSHNVYIYGGASITKDSPGQDDVHILSMPSFRWILYQKNEGAGIRYHNGFSCSVINKGQMAVIGGTYPHDQQFCDLPQAQGSHYMDLGRSNVESVQWFGYRKSLKTYNVPRDISQVIGGGPGGNANLTEPVGGFDNSDLSILFNRTMTINQRKPTRTPTPPGSPSATNKPAVNVGIIVGPSVGVGIPAIAGLLGFFLFRRRQRQKQRTGRQPLNHSQSFKGHGFRGNYPGDLTIPTNAYQLPTTQSPTAPHGPPGYGGHRFPPAGEIFPMADGKFHSPHTPMAQPGFGFEQWPGPHVRSPTELPGHAMTLPPQELPAVRDSVALGTVKSARTMDARRRGSSTTSEELVFGHEMQNKEMGGMI